MKRSLWFSPLFLLCFLGFSTPALSFSGADFNSLNPEHVREFSNFYFAEKSWTPPVYSWLKAAGNDDVRALNALIQNGQIFFNWRSDKQRNLLHLTSLMGGSKAVQFVIQSGWFDLNEKDAYGLTPLHYAVLGSNTHAINALIAEKDLLPNFSDINKQTPLHLAAMIGRAFVIQALLKSDVLLLSPRSDGFGNFIGLLRDLMLGNLKNYPHYMPSTPLTMMLSLQDFSYEAVRVLVTDPRMQLWSELTPFGINPAHIAAAQDDVELLKILSENSRFKMLLSMKTSSDINPSTPLEFAINFKSGNAALWLISFLRADLSELENYRFFRSALKDFVFRYLFESYLSGDLEKINEVDLLVQFRKKLDFALQDLKKEELLKGLAQSTLLHDLTLKEITSWNDLFWRYNRFGLYNGFFSNQAMKRTEAQSLFYQSVVAKKLIDEKLVDLNAKDSEGMTPVMSAFFRKNTDMLSVLWQYQDQIDFSVRDTNGYTVLYYAAKSGLPAYVKDLVKKPEIQKILFKSEKEVDEAKSSKELSVEDEKVYSLLREARRRVLLAEDAREWKKKEYSYLSYDKAFEKAVVLHEHYVERLLFTDEVSIKTINEQLVKLLDRILKISDEKKPVYDAMNAIRMLSYLNEKNENISDHLSRIVLDKEEELFGLAEEILPKEVFTDEKDKNGWTPLERAIWGGKLKRVKKLSKDSHILALAELMQAIVEFAEDAELEKVAQEAKVAGLDLKIKDPSGKKAADYARDIGFDEEVVQKIFK